ncbi:MAG: TorF family putative porin, partial [Blastomonas fulva]
SFAIPDTPVSLTAHIGYSEGNPGLGPNGTSVTPTGEYWDYSVGASVNVYGPLTLSVSYVDTDIGRAESAYLLPNFQKFRTGGGQIADSTIVFGVTAAF